MDDFAILEQMAEQMHYEFKFQDPYTPEIFTLCITEASELDGLAMANFFHECGLFEWGAWNNRWSLEEYDEGYVRSPW